MTSTTTRRAGIHVRLAVLAGALLALAGCSGLVEYDERDVLPPDALNNAAGAQALYAGALRSFGRAFTGDGGGTEGQAWISGLMADEWMNSETFNTRIDYDQRAHILDNGTLLAIFRQTQVARLDAHRAIDAMENTDSTAATDARFGAMYNRIAAIFMFFGMNYCSGIPFSSIVDAVPVYGTQLTTAQVLDSADHYFDQALVGAAGTTGVNHTIAQLMKARILMMRGPTSFDAAATLVANIPTTFRALNEHSTANGGTENGIFVFNTQNERFSVAHREGTNGLPFRGADPAGLDPAQADPRIPWKRDPNDVGFDNVTPMYDLLLYTARNQSSVWGMGEEARLIEAEAALQAGNTALWLQKLNELRAAVAGLVPLADPGTTEARVDLMFSERGFWLFANGTRLMDLRRLVRQYGRDSESVFPTGAYHKGGVYGPDVNFAVPTQENQNPNYATGISCIDRSA